MIMFFNTEYFIFYLFLSIEYAIFRNTISIIFFSDYFDYSLYLLFRIESIVFFLSFRFPSISEFQFHSINNRRDSINNPLIQT